MALCYISSGSSLFAKVFVKQFPEYKGLRYKWFYSVVFISYHILTICTPVSAIGPFGPLVVNISVQIFRFLKWSLTCKFF